MNPDPNIRGPRGVLRPFPNDVAVAFFMVASVVVFLVMAPLGFFTAFFSLPPVFYFGVPLSWAFLRGCAEARQISESEPGRFPRRDFRRVMLPRVRLWVVLWGFYFLVWETCATMLSAGVPVIGSAACLMLISWMLAVCFLYAPRIRRPWKLMLPVLLVPPIAVMLCWALSALVLSGLADAGLWDPGYMGMGLAFLPPVIASFLSLCAAPVAYAWSRWKGDAWFGRAGGVVGNQAETDAVGAERVPVPLMATAGFVVCALLIMWFDSLNKDVVCVGVLGGKERLVSAAADEQHAYVLARNGFEVEIWNFPSQGAGMGPVASVRLKEYGADLVLTGNSVAVADYAGLTVLDAADPAAPRVAGSLRTPDKPPLMLAAAGHLVCGINVKGLLYVFDVSDPAQPILRSAYDRHNDPGFDEYDSATAVLDAAMSTKRVLLACGTAGMLVLDLSDPSAPSLLGAYRDGDSSVRAVALDGNIACVLSVSPSGGSRFQTINLDDPARPALLASLRTAGTARDLSLAGHLAHAALGGAGVLMVDVSDPRAPRPCAAYRPVTGGNLSVSFNRIRAAGAYALAVNEASFPTVLHVLRYLPEGADPPAVTHEAPPSPPVSPTPVTSAAQPAPGPEKRPDPIADMEQFRLSDYRGKHVLLDFWARWCGPCRAEMHSVLEVYEEFGDDPRLVVLGMNLDPNPDDGKAYAAERGLGWPQVFLGDWSRTEVPKRFGVEGIPCVILFDPEGRELARDLNGPDIRAAVERALGGPGKQVVARHAARPVEEDSPAARRGPAPFPRGPASARPVVIFPGDGAASGEGLLDVNVDRDFQYINEGFPMGLAVGQTDLPAFTNRPDETLIAEPSYRWEEPRYGYLVLGNAADNHFTFVIDDFDGKTWVAWFDRNNNEDLTDDGPPVRNQGTGWFAALIALEVPVVSASGETTVRPYQFWLWAGERSASFYSRCHYQADVRVGEARVTAVVFEQYRHDALYADAGIWFDLNGNGRLDEKSEFFQAGERVPAKGGAFRVRLDYP